MGRPDQGERRVDGLKSALAVYSITFPYGESCNEFRHRQDHALQTSWRRLSIAAVVDDFIDRVMHNPILNANAAVDEAFRPLRPLRSRDSRCL
jgi:hypothetical protein